MEGGGGYNGEDSVKLNLQEISSEHVKSVGTGCNGEETFHSVIS